MKLRKKIAGIALSRIGMAGIGISGTLLMAGLVLGGAVQAGAQDKLAPAARVTYDNRYEVFGGLTYMDFQAGQNLPKKMNLGGGEILGTYWATKRIGVGLDFRAGAGTTPVLPNPYNVNRPRVNLYTGMAGAQVRGPKNHYAALNYHGYFGVSHGTFDSGLTYVPSQAKPAIGLYTNRTKPIAALGASVDFNSSKNFAVRFSPDLILEHFGTETREFFGLSGGVIYRFGKR